MFVLAFLAYVFVPHFTLGYMQGVILIGLARCIAMVLVWIDLALGDRELALSLVAFNSLFQIFFFGIMAYVFMIVLPSFLGINLQGYTLSFALVAKNVAIYLGIPFVLGFFTRFFLIKYKSLRFYEEKFIAKISPLTLIFLLYIVIVMFSYKGEALLNLPFDTLIVALPLVAYFVVMFFIAFCLSKGFGYEKSCAISFSACGNNFELSLAVAIASFGINSPQAFVSIVGVLVEVPIMLFLVDVMKKLNKINL